MDNITFTDILSLSSSSNDASSAFTEAKVINTHEILSMLAREGKALMEESEVQKDDKDAAKKTVVKKQNVVSLTLCNYPDFVLTKAMATKTVSFVYMLSSGTAFFKTVNSKGEETSELFTKTEQYTAFFAGVPTGEEVVFPEGFWITALQSGKRMGDFLRELMQGKITASVYDYEKTNRTRINIKELIINRVLQPLTPSMIYDRYTYNSTLSKTINNLASLYYYVKPLLSTILDKNRKVCNTLFSVPFLRYLISEFGIDNARDFCETIKEHHWWSLHDSEIDPHRLDALKQYRFDYKSFKNYMIYEAYHQGYGITYNNNRTCMSFFVSDWLDTLRMEKAVYGKITEKYPDNLKMLHDQLIFIYKVNEEEINENLMLERYQELKVLEGSIWGTGQGLILTVPKTKQDFLDEAAGQGNCVASYASSHAQGSSTVLFIRKKKTPDQSYITCEIQNDVYGLRLVQCKYAHNREVEYDLQDTIRKHIKKCFEEGANPETEEVLKAG